MGGPGCSILLPIDRSPAVEAAVRELLAPVVTDWEDSPLGDEVGGSNFRIGSTQMIGGRHDPMEPGQNLFGFHVLAITVDEDPADDLPLDVEPLTRATMDGLDGAFGFRPRSMVTVFSYLSGDLNHQLLGELAAYLCERLGELVSFNGSLCWRSSEPSWPPDPALDRRRAQHWERCRAAVESLPGRRTTIEEDDFADATFLRAWLAHPAFHMVK